MKKIKASSLPLEIIAPICAPPPSGPLLRQMTARDVSLFFRLRVVPVLKIARCRSASKFSDTYAIIWSFFLSRETSAINFGNTKSPNASLACSNSPQPVVQFRVSGDAAQYLLKSVARLLEAACKRPHRFEANPHNLCLCFVNRLPHSGKMVVPPFIQGKREAKSFFALR